MKLLFEFEDKQWFPAYLRTYMTDYLRFLFRALKLYNPVIPSLIKVVKLSKKKTIIDLCSGSGGPLPYLKNQLEKVMNTSVEVILTDKYPPDNIKEDNANYRYHKESVDALNIPKTLQGIFSMFSGLHHFNKVEVKKILSCIANRRMPAAIYDGGNKSLLIIIGVLLFHPILIWTLTPFIKPFSVKRLIFTYIIPLVVFFTVWDGVVSYLKLHSKQTLMMITDEIKTPSYNWEIIEMSNRFGIKIIGLIGTSNRAI